MSAAKENYQLLLDAALESIVVTKPTLLLHSCCGPCSSYVLEYLTRYFRVSILFYGPNIQPVEEYCKRLETQRRLIAEMPCAADVSILECGYDGESYTQAVRGLEAEPEGGSRCTVCFRLRIEETARLAREHGFEWFCTTLSVSPHKDAQRINAIGLELGDKYGVKWLPNDFKKRGGYQRSIELSRQYGLYRQNYCGCLFSKHD